MVIGFCKDHDKKTEKIYEMMNFTISTLWSGPTQVHVSIIIDDFMLPSNFEHER